MLIYNSKIIHMKHTNNLFKLLSVLALLILTVGCKKNFLDRQPLDRISNSKTFSDKALTEAYLFKLYNSMPIGYSIYDDCCSPFILASITDEARTKSTWIQSESTIVPGYISPTDDPLDNWGGSYKDIRVANNIILNLKTSPLDEPFKERIASEARFVRTFKYFDLARKYGDVPLITVPQSIDDTSIFVSRTPRADVYTFVASELDEIGKVLPSAANLPSAEYGRATREAAWALNGRVLLYAEKYSESATFSKKVIDANIFQLDADYNALFQSHGGSTEAIFEILFNGAEKGHSFDMYNTPIGWPTSWGSQTDPTQEMVDAYEMSNGLPITDPASGYDPNDPYKNRDSRLEASILHNGSAFKGGVLDCIFPNGISAPLRTGLSSITGYYIRKFLDESVPAEEFKSVTSWKELRYGEVLLNYAEAQNENSGPDASVYDAINEIRARAKMPDLPSALSQDEMRQRIRHERRIELAFENQRWYDLIRWKIAEQVLNGKFFHGMKVTQNSSGGLNYDPTFTIDFRNKQVFQTKNYLLPIPQEEIEKNSKLTQNPGY